MSVPALGTYFRTRIGSWRRLEWGGAFLSAFLLTGAVFPLLMSAGDGILDDAERGKLRLMLLPTYAVVLVLLSRHPSQIVVCALRNLPFVVLLALPFLSVFWSLSGSLTLRRAVGLMLSTLLPVLLAIRFTPRQQMLLLGGVLGLCTASSLLFGVLAPGLAYMPGTNDLRGLFIHKNVLGWIASLSLAFGVAMLQDSLRIVRRTGWATIVVGVAGTVLSQSVTGLLAAVVVCMASVALWAIKKQRGAARLVLGLLVLQMAGAVLVVLVLNLEPMLDAIGRDRTLTGRVPLWHEVDTWIRERPWLGYGYGAFWSPGNHRMWEIWGVVGWDTPHAHNGYRDLMLGCGIVGAALFLFIVARAMFRSIALMCFEPGGGWAWCPLVILHCLFLNLSESTFLSQNSLLWLTVASAIFTVSNGYGALAADIPRYRRIGPAAT